MKLRTMILAGTAAASLAATPTANAQVDGDGGIVGVVPSMLELSLSSPASGTFSAFAKPRTYATTIKVQATASESKTILTLADGEATSGSQLGHLVAGNKRMAAPLEASVKGAFTPLDTAFGPPLATWSTAIARAQASIKLRQKVSAKAAGTYRKVLLVTLSTDVP